MTRGGGFSRPDSSCATASAVATRRSSRPRHAGPHRPARPPGNRASTSGPSAGRVDYGVIPTTAGVASTAPADSVDPDHADRSRRERLAPRDFRLRIESALRRPPRAGMPSAPQTAGVVMRVGSRLRVLAGPGFVDETTRARVRRREKVTTRGRGDANQAVWACVSGGSRPKRTRLRYNPFRESPRRRAVSSIRPPHAFSAYCSMARSRCSMAAAIG